MGAAAAALAPVVPAFGGTRHIARITTSGTSLRAFGAPFPMYGASVYGQIDTAAKRAAVIDLALQGNSTPFGSSTGSTRTPLPPTPPPTIRPVGSTVTR